MKIAVASSGLGHVARGIETWAHDLSDALDQRGIDVTLFQGSGEPVSDYARTLSCLPRENPRNQRWAGRIPRWLAWRLALNAGYPFEQTTFAWSLLKELRRERFDILHVQDPIVALWAERARRLNWTSTQVILAHGTEEPPQFLAQFPFVQHLAPTHLEACKAAGVWRPTWTAIGNFVDTDRFSPGRAPEVRQRLGIPDDAFVLVTLAAIKRHHKRIDWLIEAVALTRAQNPSIPVFLVVAGGFERETDELVRLGTERLGDGVRFLVRHPRSQIPDLLRSADVFVLASLFEMMPIAVLEAGATGLPCLVHDEATLRWMTGPGGVTVNMEDPTAFANTVASLAAEPERRASIGRMSREYVEQTFSTDAIVERIEHYYARVAGEREAA